MSYTLKIHWTRYERDPEHNLGVETLKDEATLFLAADKIIVHEWVAGSKADRMVKQWNELGATLFDYLSVSTVVQTVGETTSRTRSTEIEDGRLIEVRKGDHSESYLASKAWILGPDGRTIERIAP